MAICFVHDAAAHWHGVEVPNNMDDVPGISQDPIAPGESFTFEFTAKPAGTHLYHSQVEDGVAEIPDVKKHKDH